MTKAITAYKAFEADWSCRGHKYEVGKTYTHDGPVEICGGGYHACLIPFDCWNYYNRSKVFARVTLAERTHGPAEHKDSKVAAAKITIEAALSLPAWIEAQASAVVALCRGAKKQLARKDNQCAAATGDGGHAAATGENGHAAATGYWGHAAATGDGGHAAATGNRGHAAATGDWGHAAATGDGGHAAATGDWGHAAATGENGHAAVTGYWGHAAATGHRGHAAATGDRGHAKVEGRNGIAAALGIDGTATAGMGGAITLAVYDDDYNLVAVRASMVGENGIEAGKTYRLTACGNFQEVEND